MSELTRYHWVCEQGKSQCPWVGFEKKSQVSHIFLESNSNDNWKWSIGKSHRLHRYKPDLDPTIFFLVNNIWIDKCDPQKVYKRGKIIYVVFPLCIFGFKEGSKCIYFPWEKICWDQKKTFFEIKSPLRFNFYSFLGSINLVYSGILKSRISQHTILKVWIGL